MRTYSEQFALIVNGDIVGLAPVSDDCSDDGTSNLT
jgi:hypothetical protein